MKLCRFEGERLGIVDRDEVIDVSAALEVLPTWRWKPPAGDPVILQWPAVRARIDVVRGTAPRRTLAGLALDAPVAMPGKIIGAPVNYHAHLDEARIDVAMHQNRVVHPIDEIGCFLKASSALTGHGAVIALPFDDVRIDHEAEIAVIIGKPAFRIRAADALEYVAGYSLALDMTVRGKQDRSLRKSCDGFAVLGPWMLTADEIADPAAIDFELTVNGERRQAASTGQLIRSIPELIEMCSAFYTLLPGDVIMTGTPAGVSQVASGDLIEVVSPTLGRLAVRIG